MKVYNFDKVISRDGTYSAKYNNKGREIIPLSVADMDIPVADFMVSELSVANQKGIYGYTLLSDDWQQVTAQWYQRHYSWKVNPEHIVFAHEWYKPFHYISRILPNREMLLSAWHQPIILLAMQLKSTIEYCWKVRCFIVTAPMK